MMLYKWLMTLAFALLPISAYADEFSGLKLLNGSQNELLELLHQGWKILQYPLFAVNNSNFSILTLLGALFILWFGFKLAKTFSLLIKRLGAMGKLSVTPATLATLSSLGYYFIAFITIIVVLSFSGIDLTSFTIIMSALSVGIGFGLQTIFSNFISGLLLMFENTIRVGDIIEIENNLAGKVTEMRMRSTTILTFDNIEVLVPNKTFVENNVVNWTLSDNIKRLKIPFGVAYGTSTEKVDDAIIKAVMTLEKDFVKEEDKKPVIRMTGMGDNSVNFELWVWIRIGVKDKSLAAHYDDFNRIIYQALNENGIAIPFPQRDLHWVSVSPQVVEALKTNPILKPTEDQPKP